MAGGAFTPRGRKNIENHLPVNQLFVLFIP
jgi:hypothetical protein